MAKFVIEPLERGCGTALGNSLPSCATSFTLPGAAVTSINIEIVHVIDTIQVFVKT